MKVVLFCGGLGTRLREHSDTIPKPLVNIGYRPILWYLMKYYAHFGHTDFIICLGYRGDMIKQFFLDYDPSYSNDFVLRKGKPQLESDSDVADWQIQFVDTGLHSNIGQRLLAVRSYLAAEDSFLANYSDQLSDLPLSEYLAAFDRSHAIAGFAAVQPANSLHAAKLADDGTVLDIHALHDMDVWVNGGYIALRQEIFEYINEGEELVEEPFRRLVAARRLFAYKYTGFWRSMDTFKDKISYDRLWGQGHTPWEVWNQRATS